MCGLLKHSTVTCHKQSVVDRRIGAALAFDSPAHLCSNPHQWTQALGSEKNETVDTNGRNEFPPKDGWLHPYRYGGERGIETLLLRIERNQLRWFGHLIRMPPGRLPLEVFQVRATGRRSWGSPRTRWRDYTSYLAWERLGKMCWSKGLLDYLS